MSYNPAKDRPKDMEQYIQLIDYWYAKEDEKAAADPAYQKQTREQIEATYSCYYPHPEYNEIMGLY